MQKYRGPNELKIKMYTLKLTPFRLKMLESLLVSEMDVVFKTMAAAFANLEIPPAYALVFYLAIFLAGLMFLVCILV